MAFISRACIKRDVTFNESDLFYDDSILAESCDLDRIVEVTKRLNDLEIEKVGSIALEMTYLFQFHCYQRYKSGHEILHDRHVRLFDVILQQLYTNEWIVLDERTRIKRRNKLANQVAVGRRWSICVGRLSHGAILLGSKKLSTLIHKRYFLLKELNELFIHIEKQYVHSLELYKRGDSLGRKYFAVGSHFPGSSCDLDELETLLQEGSKMKRGGAVYK